MRIQHNIMAMNAYRNYNINTSALSKNLEKLSSGYKINRAGDDAAGLAISEKMRAQITGLNAATKNVKDGISLVKTAEGAMQEVQDMLNRMDYLATQSANGTYDNEVDRNNLQKEVDALKTEINRIADSSNFNGIKLLDGSLASNTKLSNLTVNHIMDSQPSAGDGVKGVYSIDLSNFKASIVSTSASGTISIAVAGQTIAEAGVSTTGGTATGTQLLAGATTGIVTIGGSEFKVSTDGNKLVLTMQDVPAADFNNAMNVTVGGASTIVANNGNAAHPLGVEVETEARPDGQRVYAQGSFDLTGLVSDGYQLKIGNETYTFAVGTNSKFKSAANVVDLTDKLTSDSDLAKIASRRLSEAAAGNKMFKVTTQNNITNGTVYLTEREGAGIDYSKNNLIGTSSTNPQDGGPTSADWAGLVQGGVADTVSGLTLQIGDTADSYNQLNVIVGDIHTRALGIANINIGNQESAQNAIQSIRDAINNVSSIRGDLGAVQNRLEHTQNNLSVMAENIQDAESTIRDTDVAEEMMSYVKNNILVQSAQAMLAQANQVPQGVLQLLG